MEAVRWPLRGGGGVGGRASIVGLLEGLGLGLALLPVPRVSDASLNAGTPTPCPLRETTSFFRFVGGVASFLVSKLVTLAEAETGGEISCFGISSILMRASISISVGSELLPKASPASVPLAS